MSIKYTQEFKNKVQKLYGNTLNKYLESNDRFLGRILDDNSNGIGISANDILLATNLNDIQSKVRIHKEKQELYNEYWNQPGIKN